MLMMGGMELMIKGMGEEEMLAMGIMARVKKIGRWVRYGGYVISLILGYGIRDIVGGE